MGAVAKKKAKITNKPLHVERPKLVWRSESEPEEPPIPERGEDAVQHQGITRGRRSRLFPDLNITETAKRLGITKSHLTKVLTGRNKPSFDLAVRLADALGKDLLFVAALYNNKHVDATSESEAASYRNRKKKNKNAKGNRGTNQRKRV